jgi:hypothetical protein
MAATTKRKRSEVDAERLYRKVRRSPPPMTNAEVEETEHALNDPRRHLWRRGAFGVLSMSGEELFSKIEAADRKGAVVFAEIAIGVGDYVSNMRGILDLLESAQVRIELSLSAREDCEAVRAAAEKEYAAEREVVDA